MPRKQKIAQRHAAVRRVTLSALTAWCGLRAAALWKQGGPSLQSQAFAGSLAS